MCAFLIYNMFHFRFVRKPVVTDKQTFTSFQCLRHQTRDQPKANSKGYIALEMPNDTKSNAANRQWKTRINIYLIYTDAAAYTYAHTQNAAHKDWNYVKLRRKLMLNCGGFHCTHQHGEPSMKSFNNLKIMPIKIWA